MKKFLIIIDSVIKLAVICVMVVSCVMEQSSHKENETLLNKHVNVGEPTKKMFDDIYEFNYNGHQYIWFRQFKGYHTGWDGGIVHNPDCECGYYNSDIEYD